ncbi:MAG: hypothetical protein ACK56W_14730 [Pirellula sp.]|jgi:hypothetical protein|nr:hypothetical protein [Pirellula sp.]
MNSPNPNDPNPYSASTQSNPLPNASNINDRDATGGIIPYKNPKALIAYYLGILSGLPIIGLPIGVAAFVLGIKGLKDRKKNPVIKGSAHAWIGIGCGGFFALLWGFLLVVLIAGLVISSQST